MSCQCEQRDKAPAERDWVVLRRNYRCSAFDGYKRRWSPYSTVVCKVCSRVWRTKAAFVNNLRDAIA